MTSTRRVVIFVTMIASLSGARSAEAQTTATVTGTVTDAQGAVIPGATVTLTSETRGTGLESQTTVTGDFVLPNVTGDTYTVKVTMDGFKTSERKGVKVSPGDRVAVGTIAIKLGALSETVVVSGEAPMIQAASGERSFTVSKEQVESLPVSGRNSASFVALSLTKLMGRHTGKVGFQYEHSLKT